MSGPDRHALDRGWRLREALAMEQAELAAGRLPAVVPRDGWIEAQAPGTVIGALAQAGRIAEPLSGAAAPAIAAAENAAWWMHLAFTPPEGWAGDADAPDRRVDLLLDGLSPFATILLNGKHLGEHQSEFFPFRADLRGLLKDGPNHLHILFQPEVPRLLALEREHGERVAANDRLRVHARRMQCLSGDGTMPRLAAPGLRGGAWLERASVARVLAARARCGAFEADAADVHLGADIEVLSREVLQVQWSLHRLDPVGAGSDVSPVLAWRAEKTQAFEPGKYRLAEKARVAQPSLWWPAGVAGRRRTLYAARLRLSRGDTVLAESGTRLGLRRIRVHQHAPGGSRGFTLEVNGLPLFVRGAWWNPMGVLDSGATDDDLRARLQDAADAGFNLLRVGAHGAYQRDAFHDRCDELGLLVWQDFMFCEGDYPDHDDFWRLVQREATHQVCRLRNHASTALFCGGWKAKSGRAKGDATGALFARLLAKIVEEEGNGLAYLAASPCEAPWRDAPSDAPGAADIVSDLAAASMPGEQATRLLDAAAPAVRTERERLRATLRTPQSDEELEYLSQWLQGHRLRSAIDGLRLARPRPSAVLVRALNESWPGVTPSLVDFAGRRKLSWWMAREAMQPLTALVAQREGKLEVHLVNDALRREPPWEVVVRVRGLRASGETLAVLDWALELPTNASTLVWSGVAEELGIRSGAECAVAVEVLDGNTVLAARLFPLWAAGRAELPEVPLRGFVEPVIGGRRALVALRAEGIILGAQLAVEGHADAVFRGAGAADYWPGREAWVEVQLPEEADAGDLADLLRVRSLNDAAPGRTVHWRQLALEVAANARAAQMASRDEIRVSLRPSGIVPALSPRRPTPPSHSRGPEEDTEVTPPR